MRYSQQPIIEVTPAFVLVEWGPDVLADLFERFPCGGEFTIFDPATPVQTYRLVVEVELDEHPIICLPDLSGGNVR